MRTRATLTPILTAAIILLFLVSCQSGKEPAALPQQAFIPPTAPANPQVQTAAINKGALALPTAMENTPDDGFSAFAAYSGGFLTNGDGSPFLDQDNNPVPIESYYAVKWNAQADALGAMQAGVSVMDHAILPTALNITLNAASGFQGKNAEIIAERTNLAAAILQNLAPSIRSMYEGRSGLIKVRSDGLVDIITASGGAVSGVLKAATPIGAIADGLSVVLQNPDTGANTAHVVTPVATK